MPAEINKEVKLEIVHVLFLDVVGYSKHPTDEQGREAAPQQGTGRRGRNGTKQLVDQGAEAYT